MKPRQELSAREVEELHAGLMRRLGDSSIPTLPQVALKVIQLVSNPNSALKDFVDVIQTDQALTGRLLRTANSAYFAQRTPVTQLQRAMVLLGLDRLKAMALGFHLSQASMSKDADEAGKRIWTQGLYRAWLAFRIAEQFDRRVTGEAFIVGLMLDAGVPMMGKLAGDPYKKNVPLTEGPARQFAAEFKGLPFTHVDVVASLCKMWKLPEVLTKPICGHHSPPASADSKSPSSILNAAAYYVGSLNLDSLGEGESKVILPALAERLFKLSAQDMQRLMKSAAADFKGSRDLFKHIIDAGVSVEKILSAANEELSGMVEGMVHETLARPASEEGAVRFEADGLVLEMLGAEHNKVKVFIADADGNRLLSEEIDPRDKEDAQLRSMLLLDNTPEATVLNVVGQMRRMAA